MAFLWVKIGINPVKQHYSAYNVQIVFIYLILMLFFPFAKKCLLRQKIVLYFNLISVINEGYTF